MVYIVYTTRPSTIPSFTQFPCIQYRYLWYLVPGTIIDQESDDLK